MKRTKKGVAQHRNDNVDSEGLGWFGDGRLIFGYVDKVNGPGAVEVQTLAPTRDELFQLAKYWARVVIEIDFFYFLYQQTGSSEIRTKPFARRRSARIAEVLGEEKVARARWEALREYSKHVDPRTWNIFVNGTPKEQRAFRDEMRVGQIRRESRKASQTP